MVFVLKIFFGHAIPMGVYNLKNEMEQGGKGKQLHLKTESTTTSDQTIWDKVWGQIFVNFHLCLIQAKVYINLSPHFI